MHTKKHFTQTFSKLFQQSLSFVFTLTVAIFSSPFAICQLWVFPSFRFRSRIFTTHVLPFQGKFNVVVTGVNTKRRTKTSFWWFHPLVRPWTVLRFLRLSKTSFQAYFMRFKTDIRPGGNWVLLLKALSSHAVPVFLQGRIKWWVWVMRFYLNKTKSRTVLNVNQFSGKIFR